MCKTCGCAAANNLQLELQVQSNGKRIGQQDLYARLIGAAGVLHVNIDDNAGQVLADFSPQRTSKQHIENIVTEAGYEIISAEVHELAHQHGAVAFLKRIFGK